MSHGARFAVWLGIGTAALCGLFACRKDTTGGPVPTLVEAHPVSKPKPPREDKVSLGQVARTGKGEKIYSKPSESSSVLSTVEPNSYLVVKTYGSDPRWNRVLLNNLTYGFARSAALTRLPYEYKVPAPKAKASWQEGVVASARLLVGGKAPRHELVSFVFKRVGGKLPANLDEQLKIGAPVKRLEDLRAADRLYFWDSHKEAINEAGIYVGNGYFIHREGANVTMDYLGKPTYMKSLIAARRSAGLDRA